MTLQQLLPPEGEICILGYGREGRAMLNYLYKHLPQLRIEVRDAQPGLVPEEQWLADARVSFLTGENYLEGLERFEVIIKSPGIPHHVLNGKTGQARIVSQTGIFLQMFASQVIGITGTKGKSTTSSLIHHFLQSAGKKSILLGNIGIPAISRADEIDAETLVVFELSSHQLEDTCVSPHMAVLLNVFEEHLDHYPSYEAYQQAKYNIARFQGPGDYLIYHADNPVLKHLIQSEKPESRLIPYDFKLKDGVVVYQDENVIHAAINGNKYIVSHLQRFPLRGEHNRLNLMAATAAVLLCGVSAQEIERALPTFNALPHRLEYVGCFGGKHFYNDSIATIPEAAIHALQALGKVDVWIGGGYDRGIHYDALVDFLIEHPLPTVALTGKAGEIIREGLLQRNYPGDILWKNNFRELVEEAVRQTPEGGVCLLSPAAASYDAFKNFEERGDLFRKIVSAS
ncbi:MAG: UDP-N-acetylmuramoyl-L-alanine--D-glutamate ligase [Bacteroidales bacterium]